jgi:hypothetical protein
VTFFPSNRLNIFHPPEQKVSTDMLFEKELLFVWDSLLDPQQVKQALGRRLPFTPGMIEGYECSGKNLRSEWTYSLAPNPDAITTGVVLIGLDQKDFVVLDQFQQAPIFRVRTKVRCRIGNIERIVSVYVLQGALIED